MAAFVCNICGTENSYSGEPFEREEPGCTGCGSSLRTRALMVALSTELFGIPLRLSDFPRVKSLRGLGTSDSSQYAVRLAEVFDYRNTFYDRQPRFDLGEASEQSDSYDFVVSSDVFEHVAPPNHQAFRNAYDMLKPGGVLVFTVPYEIEESAEHFPDLYEYGLAEVGDRIVMVNRTRAGEMQVFENLTFHRSGAGKTLEMRVFSEKMLRDVLAAGGFQQREDLRRELQTFWDRARRVVVAADRGAQGTFCVRQGRDARCHGGMARSENDTRE